MRAPVAVGREAELAEVDAFLGDLRSASCALAVEGEPGIGKTTIWQQAVDRAVGAGVLALGRDRRRRKQWSPARHALRQALTLFEQTGARLWVQETRR